MGWDNPPVPWRELQRRMSWRTNAERTGDQRTQGQPAPGQPAPGQPTPDRAPGRRASRPAGSIPWAELHCHSLFSFLDGAATPGELVAEAARLGLEVLALTDHDGMYGVPQFAQAAARLGDRGSKLGTVFGAELSLQGGSGGPKRSGGPRGSGGKGSPSRGGGQGGRPPGSTQSPAGAGP